jgi:NADH-quinone oxidoreductase subunit N
VASKSAGFVALIQLVFIGFFGRSDVVQPFMFILRRAR